MNKFITPQYQDTFRFNWEFEQYKDKSNFWLEVDYVINRDDFESRVADTFAESPRLDWNLTAENGKRIFRNFDVSKYQNRGYRLLNEIPEISNADEDILKVTELYGYAPSETFCKYGFEGVTVYGTEIETESPTIRTKVFGYTCYTSEAKTSVPMNSPSDASQFTVGDVVKLSGEYTNYDKEDGLLATFKAFESTPSTVLDILGDRIFCEPFSTADGELGASFLNNAIIFNGTTYAQPKYLTRIAMKRAPRIRSTPYREEIQYFNSKPSVTERFVPLTAIDQEVDTITRNTIPNIETWLQKVENGDEIVSADSEIIQLHKGMWVKRTKYVKAR